MSPADRLRGMKLEREDSDYLKELGRLEEKNRLVSPKAIIGKVKQLVKAPPQALMMPWGENAFCISRFYPKRWTVWSGVTFAGKTSMLRNLMLYGLSRHEKFLFCSLEEDDDEALLEIAAAAALGNRAPPDQFLDYCADAWDERMYLFQHQGSVDPKVLLGVVCYAAAELGVTQVVIDSMMRLKMRQDDNDASNELAQTISHITKKWSIHIHFVIHPRKTQNSQEMLDLHDIKGAGELVNNADNVITIQRAPEIEKVRKAHGIPDWKNITLYRQWKQRGAWNKAGTQFLRYYPSTRQWGAPIEEFSIKDGAPEPGFTKSMLFLPKSVYLECGLIKGNAPDPRQHSLSNDTEDIPF